MIKMKYNIKNKQKILNKYYTIIRSKLKISAKISKKNKLKLKISKNKKTWQNYQIINKIKQFFFKFYLFF